MKMVFSGKVRSLMGILVMFQKIIQKSYWAEYKAGTVKYYWGEDFSPDMKAQTSLTIETSVPEFESQMSADYGGLKGRVKRASLRASGVKVELVR